MAYVITHPCTGVCDTECVEVCPCDCIVGPVPLDQVRQVPRDRRSQVFAGVQLFIDPDECIDCGACVPECPVEAIYEQDSVPDECRADIERNAAFFRS